MTTSNVLKMAREGLRHALVTALHVAASTLQVVRRPGLCVKTDGDDTWVDLSVRPVGPGPAGSPDVPLFLVVLEPAAQAAPRPAPDAAPASGGSDEDPRVLALQEELRTKEEHLRSANEELETSNEELKSSNEEMQSVNEELQSTNEELETSKEELQSVNEELATINAELQAKVADLSRANGDMKNLLANTGIGTVFVDSRLRIVRFTPLITDIIHLIPGDIGRPVAHIVSNLEGYDRLEEDTQAVLDTLVPRETEVQTRAGAWYSLRILPYRTLDNVIDGAVITFIDIGELKRSRDILCEAEALRRLAQVARDASDAIVLRDPDGRILAWNPAAEKAYGWTEAEALTMNVRSLVPEDGFEQEQAAALKLAQAAVQSPCLARRVSRDGRVFETWITATALVNETGNVYAVATTERKR